MSSTCSVKTAAATAKRLRAAEIRKRARMVLVQNGMTVEEIATVMGTSPDAVRQALARDMRKSGSGSQCVDEDGLVWA